MDPQNKQWMVPYFLLFQLHAERTSPARFINFRAVHNKKPEINILTGRSKDERETETLLNESVQISTLRSRWLGLDANNQPTQPSLYEQLVTLNTSESKPTNIYFGVNPRLIKLGNKKEHVEGFVSFYLDMDSHKGYTKEQRWMQIQFLIDFGMPPTVVIDSGNGYHVYWILNTLCESVLGEQLEKHMIAQADCKGGGNVSDVTRVLRLPGFFNCKNWWNQERPVAGVAYPANFMEAMEKKIILPRYAPEIFNDFPACSLKDLAYYKKKALVIHPYDDAQLKTIMREIVLEHGRLTKDQQARLAATEVATEKSSAQNKKPIWEPTLRIVPPLEDIKFPRGKAWMRKYCKFGFDGLSAEDFQKVANNYGCQVDELSPSEMDSKIIYSLIVLGYTYDAVREFWLRPENRLYRADKEKRSPNYFGDTYAKMLESAKNAFIDGEKASINYQKTDDPITVDDFKTLASVGQKVEVILNAEFVLKNIFEDLDATEAKNQEWYEIEARVKATNRPDGYRPYTLLMPRSSFNSLKEFKENCYDRVTLTTDKPSNLHRILNYLFDKYPNAPKCEFNTRINYREGQYIFPGVAITKKGFISTSILDANKILQKRFSIWDWTPQHQISREGVAQLLKDKWGNLLRLHLPRVVSSVLGLIGASALRPRLRLEKKIDSFHLPTVNIRGDSHSGKSESVIILSSLTGVEKKKNLMSVQSSQFAIHRMMHISDFIPVIIDEFKETDQNSHKIEMIRDLVRRAYTGESLIKGRADLTVDVTNLHSSMIVVGENELERIGNIAETTRCLPINTNEFRTAQNHSNFIQMSGTDWTVVGPHFYRYMLDVDLDQIYNRFKLLHEGLIVELAQSFGDERLRVAHNIATILIGCELWDMFIKSMGVGIPSLQETLNPREALVSYMCQWAQNSGQNLKITVDVPEEPALFTPQAIPPLNYPSVPPDPSAVTPAHAGNGNSHDSLPANTLSECAPVPAATPVKKTKTFVITKNELIQWIGHLSDMITMRKNSVLHADANQVPIFNVNHEKDAVNIHFDAAYQLYAEHFNFLRKIPTSYSKLCSQISSAKHRQALWFIGFSKVAHDGSKQNVLSIKRSICRDMGVWNVPESLEAQNEQKAPLDAPKHTPRVDWFNHPTKN